MRWRNTRVQIIPASNCRLGLGVVVREWISLSDDEDSVGNFVLKKFKKS